MKSVFNANVKTATGFIAWYMRACRFAGWSSFWRTIYVLPGFENDQRLLRHERKHLEQIERDGRVVFSIKYLYWLVKHGYWNVPYEVEAREAEYQTQQPQNKSEEPK